MGSSPILAQSALGSSVGRARTQRKMHLVYIAGWSSRLARLAHYQKVSGSNPLPATRYSTGGAMAAHLAHYQETTFESFGCNQRSVGVSPFSKMPDSVNTDFVSFNYHRRNNARPRQAALDMWLCGKRFIRRRSKTYTNIALLINRQET